MRCDTMRCDCDCVRAATDLKEIVEACTSQARQGNEARDQ